jgi:hypothetical protein
MSATMSTRTGYGIKPQQSTDENGSRTNSRVRTSTKEYKVLCRSETNNSNTAVIDDGGS